MHYEHVAEALTIRKKVRELLGRFSFNGGELSVAVVAKSVEGWNLRPLPFKPIHPDELIQFVADDALDKRQISSVPILEPLWPCVVAETVGQ